MQLKYLEWLKFITLHVRSTSFECLELGHICHLLSIESVQCYQLLRHWCLIKLACDVVEKRCFFVCFTVVYVEEFHKSFPIVLQRFSFLLICFCLTSTIHPGNVAVVGPYFCNYYLSGKWQLVLFPVWTRLVSLFRKSRRSAQCVVRSRARLRGWCD